MASAPTGTRPFTAQTSAFEVTITERERRDIDEYHAHRMQRRLVEANLQDLTNMFKETLSDNKYEQLEQVIAPE